MLRTRIGRVLLSLLFVSLIGAIWLWIDGYRADALPGGGSDLPALDRWLPWLLFLGGSLGAVFLMALRALLASRKSNA